MPTVLIGAHVSTRGGIQRAIDNALAIGADVFQTHPTPPQQWRQLVVDEPTAAAFTRRFAGSGLRAHYFHAAYLVNLATPKPTLLRQSTGSLVHSLELAGRLGASAVIFHPGSHMGAGFAATVDQMVAAIEAILSRTDSPARLLVENSAGAGSCVGCSLEEVGAIVARTDPERVGVCLDTAHLYASGYDVRDDTSLRATLDSFEAAIGFDRLALVHANDSRSALGSAADRHANIGEGEIGVGAFERMLGDPRLRPVPWILEVPGQGSGPDLDNVNRLRACAGLAPASPREPAGV